MHRAWVHVVGGGVGGGMCQGAGAGGVASVGGGLWFTGGSVGGGFLFDGGFLLTGRGGAVDGSVGRVGGDSLGGGVCNGCCWDTGGKCWCDGCCCGGAGGQETAVGEGVRCSALLAAT